MTVNEPSQGKAESEAHVSLLALCFVLALLLLLDLNRMYPSPSQSFGLRWWSCCCCWRWCCGGLRAVFDCWGWTVNSRKLSSAHVDVSPCVSLCEVVGSSFLAAAAATVTVEIYPIYDLLWSSALALGLACGSEKIRNKSIVCSVTPRKDTPGAGRSLWINSRTLNQGLKCKRGEDQCLLEKCATTTTTSLNNKCRRKPVEWIV